MADRSAGTVQVEGAKQLRSTLKRAGADLGDLTAAHKQAAEIAARASAALAPRRSGALADSVRGAGTKTAGIIRAGKKSVPYANAVHWGRRWWPNKDSPRATPSRVAAQPFMSQGAQDTEGRWLPLYEAAIEKIIDKVEGA